MKMPVKKTNLKPKWQPVRLDGEIFSNGIDGLVGIEELHEYDIETFKSSRAKSKKKDKKKDKKAAPIGPIDTDNSTVDDTYPELKLLKKRKNDAEEEVVGQKQKKKKKRTQKAKPKGWSVSDLSEEQMTSNDNNSDMSAWKALFVPPPVLRALAEQSFTEPTQIQTLALPPAIMGRRDILGAAETGSGKTLAFGIPIIHGILDYRDRLQKGLVEPIAETEVNPGVESMEAEFKEDPDEELDEEEKNSDDEMENSGEEEKSDTELEEDDVTTGSDEMDEGEGEEASDEEADFSDDEEGVGCVKVVNMGLVKSSSAPRNKLHALVLTPTRELAIQVKNHLVAATKYCNIKVATVVGGMSQDKQERVLRKGPDIVVATPGRLWELIKEGNAHLQQVDNLPYLVIDEADRMLERGHFQELRDLLERMETLGGEEKQRTKRQTLVFSATLTLVHEPPPRLKNKQGKKKKKKPMRQTPGQKLQELINLLGMTRPKVIDVTAKQCTVDSLTEAYIPCALEEKDAHLYCFLQRHPGRTLVFCNSVSCVRRLVQLFTLLKCKPQALHAQMAQKQRLRSLDRFSADSKGLLLATDVAARGLDIPNVQHVIHYQVPRTSESYVHRSGRTARAHNSGLTVLLVEPKEMPLYSRLCRTLGREHELPEFPVDGSLLVAVQARVQTARQLEALEHTQRRCTAEESWLNKAAKELDLHFDEHDKLPIKGPTEPGSNRGIAARRKDLQKMLSRPLLQVGRSARYPTSTGSLQVPFAGEAQQNAIALVKASKAGDIKSLGTALGFSHKKKRKFKHKKRKK